MATVKALRLVAEGGVRYDKGASFDVTQPRAERLRELGLVAIVQHDVPLEVPKDPVLPAFPASASVLVSDTPVDRERASATDLLDIVAPAPIPVSEPEQPEVPVQEPSHSHKSKHRRG